MFLRVRVVYVLAWVALGVAGLLVFASCGKKVEESADVAARSKTDWARTGATLAASKQDSLEVTVALNEGGYAMLEPVVMTLIVHNPSGDPIDLTFPTAQRYDFVVSKGKRVIWQWGEGRVFAQAVGRHTMEPGDSMRHEFTWDQKATDGTQPPLGRYTVQGILKTEPQRVSRPLTFGIVD